jgi:hypothetical protein
MLFVIFPLRALFPRPKVLTVAHLTNGQIFGEMALVDPNHHRNASIIATTPTTVMLLHRADFMAVFPTEEQAQAKALPPRSSLTRCSLVAFENDGTFQALLLEADEAAEEDAQKRCTGCGEELFSIKATSEIVDGVECWRCKRCKKKHNVQCAGCAIDFHSERVQTKKKKKEREDKKNRKKGKRAVTVQKQKEEKRRWCYRCQNRSNAKCRGCGNQFMSGAVDQRGEKDCKSEVCASCEADSIALRKCKAIECVLCAQKFHHAERTRAQGGDEGKRDSMEVGGVVCSLCRDLAQTELWKCKGLNCGTCNSGLTVRG